ncbi:TonB-dependent receptor [Dyadobacter helix]|nr:TonB-dependent receptor [Dyadobacter sp. CECT 9275]
MTATQLLFAVLLTGLSYASPTLSQELLKERLSISVRGGSLKSILKDIEKQVDVSFSYQKNVIALDEKISIEVKNETLDDLLSRVLTPRNISYQLVNVNQVVLTKMKVNSKEPSGAVDSKKISHVLEKQIAGKVTDEKGEGLPGVSIVIKGSQMGTSTEADGTYRLAIPGAKSVLIFSYVGYISEEKVVGDQLIMNVVLKIDNKALDEVVVTAFGQKQHKEAVVGAVTTIRPSDLKIPASNLTTAIAGRLSGVIGYQRGGEPGVDNATFFIRGITTFGTNNSPLILVDNVELTVTDLARLQPDDIESFSILKDASATALYGARGANGVVYVTTKQGKAGKAKINFRIENSVSMPTQNVELADPITYMKLYNEAQLTRDPLAPIKYSQNQIDNTLRGGNPYIYPATDWRKALFKKYTQNRRGNLSVSGGGEVAQYYVATSFSNDNGILKVDKMNNFNNNVKLNNYSVRSNVNINLSGSTQLIVRLYGNFDDYNGPIDGGSGLYQKALKTSPTSYPAFYAPDEDNKATDHILFGNFDQGQYLNPYADMVKGYKQYSRSKMLTQLELTQKLDFLVKGLNVRGLANINRYSYFDVTRAYNPYFYRAGSYDKQTDTYRLNWLNQQTSQFFSEPATEYLNYKPGSKDLETFLYLQGTADYTRVFKEVHSVNATIVTTLQQSLKNNSTATSQPTLQLSLPSRNTGISGRLSYSFDNRYFAEFNFGYNGSERFYKTKQFGFFPTIGGAWVISNENFWKPVETIVNKLKVRGSFGLVGNDAIGSAYDRFFFLSEVNLNDTRRGATFGFNSNTYREGVSISRYENKDITWETSHQTNLGLEFSLLQKLNVIAEIYKQRRSNILMTRASIPTTTGLSVIPQANVGEAKSKGFDLAVDFNQNFSNGAWMIARGNLTMARGIYSVYEEPDYQDRYLSKVGQSITQPRGLIAERLFIDENDVKNSPRQNFGTYGAGDLKYRDINRDGQITNADFVPIGFPETPEITYGFGLSAGRNQFDFSVFFQGLGRESFFINPVATAPFINYPYDNNGINPLYPSNLIGENALLKAFADSHWSEENQDIYAVWPRLSTSVNQNNSQRSTWYMRDGSFLRLKTLEAGYTVKGKLLDNLKITNMRFYFSGTNLLTFSKFKLWDPEMGGNGLGYPVQKVYNIGLNLNF